MRVSSNTFNLVGNLNLSSKQSQLNKLNEQLGTFKRINRPSDDPIASSTLVNVKNSISINKQVTENAKFTNDRLSMTDAVLGNVSDMMFRLKELAVQAANSGALGDGDRKNLGAELRQNIAHMVGLANADDGSGSYLFGGTNTTEPPFAFVPPPIPVPVPVPPPPPPAPPPPPVPTVDMITYKGNEQRQYVSISNGRQVAVTEPGSDIFGGSSANQPVSPGIPNLWQSLAMFDDALHTSIVDGTTATAFKEKIAQVISGIDGALTSVSTARASIGSRQKETEAVIDMNEKLAINYASQASNLEDLDVPKAISDFQMAKTALEVSQKTFMQIKNLSLFNFL